MLDGGEEIAAPAVFSAADPRHTLLGLVGASELPPEFVEAAVIPADPHTVDPAEIDANRSTWIDEWTELVIG